MKQHIILFLAANPGGTDPRALDREARAIQKELESTAFRDCFDLVTRWAVEPLDLLRELRKLKPTVVHFSGHGSQGVAGDRRTDPAPPRDVVAGDSTHDGDRPQHGLYFQGPDGRARLVSAEALGKAFGAAGDSVKLVVLSACYSVSQAEALLAHVDCVVGMSGLLHDDAARSFAIGFYGGLGERASVAAAYKQGRAAISLEGLRDADHSQLLVRDGVDATRLVLAADLPARQSVASPTGVIEASQPVAGPAAASPAPSKIDIGGSPPVEGRSPKGEALAGMADLPEHLRWSPDCTLLAASVAGACWSWIRKGTWLSVASHAGLSSTPHCCDWLARELLVARDSAIQIVDGSGTRPFAFTEMPIAHLLSADAKVLCVDVHGGLYAFEATRDGGRLLNRASSGDATWSECAISPRGEAIALATSAGDVVVWGASQRLVRASVDDGIRSLAFIDANTLCVVQTTGTVALFAVDPKRLQPAQVPPIDSSKKLTSVTSAPRPRKLALANSHEVEVFSCTDWRRVAALAIPDARCIALAHNGTSIAVATPTSLASYLLD